MRLNGIEFGPCLDAAGLRGFKGEGYWFHYPLPFMYRFGGSTFVAKTTTLSANEGHMLLRGRRWNFAPKRLMPDCIWANPLNGTALNAVGLSGPGFESLAAAGLFKVSKEPYMISFASIAQSAEERAAECAIFVHKVGAHLRRHPELRKIIGLQINVTCPNTGHNTSEHIREARRYISAAYELGIPIIAKVNLLATVEMTGEIASHPGCAAICCTNAIPFGTELPEYLGEQVPWKTLFPNGSPLAKYGGGGLSGKWLLPRVAEWIRIMRKSGIMIPLNAGGGILRSQDVDTLVNAGLRRSIDSVFIGSIAFLRPWNIRSVIRRAHDLLA